MGRSTTVEGPGSVLRPMRIDDAAFMLDLRRRPTRNRFIHETDPDLERQRAWIADKLSCVDDLTYILVSKVDGRPRGAISIYEIDVRRRMARQGRWLTAPGSRCVAEFALLGYELIFEVLGIEVIYAKIPAPHKTVIAFQERLGARLIDAEPEHTTVPGGVLRLLRYELSAAVWPKVKAELEATVRRQARRGQLVGAV